MNRTIIASLALLALLIPGAALSLTNSTISDGSWNNPVIWSLGQVPANEDTTLVRHFVDIDDYSECLHLIIADTGSIAVGYGYRSLVVYGNLVADGDILASSWPLTFVLHGDVTINGLMANATTEFRGSGDQRLSCGSGAVMASDNMTVHGGGTLSASSPVRFGGILNMGGETLTLEPGGEFEFVSGGCYEGSIHADGRTVRSADGVEFEFLTIDRPVLRGVIEVAHGVAFTGDAVLEDTLRTSYGNVTVTAENLVNHGLITDGDWTLDLHISGDLTNLGIVENRELSFEGAGLAHRYEHGLGSILEPEYAYLDAGSGPLTLAGAAEIAGMIDLEAGTLRFEAGASLELTGGYLRNGVVDAAGGVLSMTESAYVHSVTITDPILQGFCNVYGDASFAGQVMNEGLFRNAPGVWGRATVDGELLNLGVVSNEGGNTLSLDISGTLRNRGDWNALETRLIGTNDQLAYLNDAHPLAQTLVLVSHLGGTGHTWTLNGVPQDGLWATDASLSPADGAHHGVWQCHSSAGSSRLITIEDSATDVSPVDLAASLRLFGNHPNPFNPVTTIRFSLSRESEVALEVFDAMGRRVDRTEPRRLPAGPQTLRWDAEDLPSGHYLYRLRANGDDVVGRCVLVK